MTSPLLTTGAPPVAPNTGVGLVFAQMVVSFAPQIIFKPVPDVTSILSLTPNVVMRTPSTMIVQRAVTTKMVASAEVSAGFDVKLSPTVSFSLHNRAVAELSVTPQLQAAARAAVSAALTVTPTAQASISKKYFLEAGLTVEPVAAVNVYTPGLTSAALQVIPQTTASVKPVVSAALRVNPMTSAHAAAKIHAALTVTPTSRATLPLPVSYDATGTSSVGNTAAQSWTHTIAGNAVLVWVSWSDTGASDSATATAGGVSMTQLGTTVKVADNQSSGYYVYLALFGLLNGPTGHQTVTAHITSSGGTYGAVANSVSYNNVTGFGTPVTNTGTTKAASLSVSSALSQMVAAGFASGGYSSFTGFSTSRFNQAANGADNAMVIGDAAGASTVSFSPSQTAAYSWDAIGVPLL